MISMPDADYLEPNPGLLREVMDAHGGFAAWDGAKAVRAVMSTGGVLFLMRTTRDAFHQTEVVVDLHSPHTEIRDFPRGGQNAFFTPKRVWIEDRDGQVVTERHDPRASFRGIRKQLHWDHLDSVYFAGYAVWNYISAPYLLCRRDLTIEDAAPCVDKGRTWRGLTVTFPETVPTHSAKQGFYFDQQARLRRHDYHGEVIGPYAHASHYCDDHLKFGKAVFPTRRKVVPRIGGGTTLPFPTLVWIRVHEAALQSS
jgi:hypothetical protein